MEGGGGCMEAGAINHVSLTGETGERRHRSPAACHRSACNERIRADGGRSQPFIWRSRRPSATHTPSAVGLKLLPAGSFIPGFESDRGRSNCSPRRNRNAAAITGNPTERQRVREQNELHLFFFYFNNNVAVSFKFSYFK